MENLLKLMVLVLELSFLGIFVAFNPLLLISELVIILKSKKPLLNTLIFMIGVATPLILFALVGAVIFQEDTYLQPFHSSIQLSPVVNIAIGIILILIAIRQFINHQDLPAKTAEAFKKSTASLSYASIFSFAFFRSALSFTSIIGILAATKLIKEYTDNYILILLGVFWTICIGMLPFLGLLGASLKRPDALKFLEQRVDPILNKNYKASIKWICLILGIYFIAKGLIVIF